MFPYFTVFGKEIGLYPVLGAIGVLLALYFAYKTAVKRNIDEINMLNLMLISFGVALVGAHIFYGLVNWSTLVKFFTTLGTIDSFDTFLTRVVEVFGGGVFYGGLIFGVIAGLIYYRKKKLTVEYMDIIIVSVPLFHGFGRIGCFMGGCCYGMECDFGFVYTNSLVEAANGVRRFPVQLLEAALLFILFFVFAYLEKKGKFKGLLAPLYLIMYSVVRFSLEFLRGDLIRGHFLMFSTSQWISIGLIIAALIWIWIAVELSKRRKIANL